MRRCCLAALKEFHMDSRMSLRTNSMSSTVAAAASATDVHTGRNSSCGCPVWERLASMRRAIATLVSARRAWLL
jgi:hypothetical protein